jgi:hypothetical protein
MFKKIHPEVANKLLKVINLSLQTGVIPKNWKRSKIIPIPKVKSPKLPHEVTPVNMLPILEKILKLCIHEELMDYFENIGLFYNKQFGFRRKSSTEDAIQLL